MAYRVLPWLFACLVGSSSVAAEHAPRTSPGGNPLGDPANEVRKQARAVRIGDGKIRLDGRLEEEIWQRATPLTDFVQKEPTEGELPSERMGVRFLYDATALYVGARMWSRDPTTIQAPLGRRDTTGQAEEIFISFDTYLDRRTAYTFGVTAAGVRLDFFHPTDSEGSVDAGFDPVWEARVSPDPTGWTAELWIPFSQLRFNRQDEQVWGLNVARFTPTFNELAYWVLIPRTVTAWSSRFGELRGLDSVRPTRRLELLPYLSGSAEMTGRRDRRNPFDDGRNLGSRTGADLKMGLGSALTLDVTVNPDFGQVEADPAEVNLTAIETVFPEKRPFFLEGARLMNSGVANGGHLFNSRRIGGRPTGAASGDYIDYPKASTILTAAKITGRTASGMSVGMLGAITDEESARISNLDAPGITAVQVAPMTAYGLGRLQQQFGRWGSTASVMFTGVHRDLHEGNPLALHLARRAFGLGGDAVLRFKGGEYQLSLVGLMNYVTGEAAAIERIQRSSVHYLQRPDRRYSRLDPTRTSFNGYKTIAALERRSGRHWLWDTNIDLESPGFETNDIGRTVTGDGIQHNANLRYRETQPGRLFRTYTIVLNTHTEWVYDGDLVGRTMRPSLSVTFRNFWTASGSVTRTFRAYDALLTRGGPLMQRPAAWSGTTTVANAATAQTRWSATATASGNEDGGRTRQITGAFSFRPGPRWQLSIEPLYNRTTDAQQYLTTLGGGRPETYGRRYVFAVIDRSTISSEIRMGFTLRPDVNLDIYAEPFASTGHYRDFGELLLAGGRARLTYGTEGGVVDLRANGDRAVSVGSSSFMLTTRDFNVRSLRSNVVLRWEWRPGSTLYLVWQQDRERVAELGSRVGFGDLLGSLTAPGSHILAIKTSFWVAAR